MGFRNPFRIQVDEQRRRLRHRLLARLRGAGELPRAGRHRPRGDRAQGRPTTAGRCASRPKLPVLPLELQHQQAAGRDADGQHECGNPTAGRRTSSRWNTDGDPAIERGRVNVPPITQPDIWYSYRDNANPPLGTPCLAYYDGSGGTCPQLFPELYTGGVAPHGAVKYRYDASNPSPTKFPPYYDDAIFLGEFGQDTLREVRLDANNKIFKINRLPRLRRLQRCRATPKSRSSATTRWTCSSGPTALLPADLRRRLLQPEPRRGHVPLRVRQGPARAAGELINATPTNGIAPLSVQFSSEGSRDPDPGDSISSRGTSTATARSTRSTRTRRTSTPPTASTRPS